MNADPTIREDADTGASGGASAPTIREDLTPGAADGTAAATIREPADATDADGNPPAATEEVESTAPAPSLNLVRGAAFLGYRLTEPLKVMSGEADLWHLARQNDGKRFVLKLYRHGIRPKKEIVDAFHGLRFEHIVEVLERGAMDGRHYEVQEFIANGSLADLIERGPAADLMTREIVRELAEALQHLHALNILHRDIKPSNILVRTWEPLDLVLTDFGISSVADLSLHLTTASRTAAYAAPEALTGVVAKASDWWSAGMLLAELLAGKHPLEGLSERAINLHLVMRGIPIPKHLPAEWQLLLKGLLTRDYARRWGAEQVHAWLQGKRDIPVHYDSDKPSREASGRAFQFCNQDYDTPQTLAEALAQRWEDGVKRLDRGLVLEWVKKEVGDADLTNTLLDINEDERLTADQKLTVTLLAMNASLPVVWKGEVITPEWLSAHPKESAALLESGVPAWLKKLRGDGWLQDLKLRREVVIQEAQMVHVYVDWELLERLAPVPTEKLQAAAKEIQDHHLGSQVPLFDKLLKQTEWSDPEAILLLACHPSRLWSKQQQWGSEVHDRVKRLQLMQGELGKRPLNCALLENLLNEIESIETSLESRFAELSAPYPLEPGADQAARELTNQIRAEIQSLMAKHQWQQGLIAMAAAGHLKRVRKAVVGSERIFNDVDYDAVDRALDQRTKFYTTLETECERLRMRILEEPPPWMNLVAIFQRPPIDKELEDQTHYLLREVHLRLGKLSEHPETELTTEAAEILHEVDRKLREATSRLALRQRTNLKRAWWGRGILAFMILEIVLTFHIWMLAHSILRFQIQANGKPVALSPDLKVFWNGQPVNSGTAVKPGSGTLRVESPLFDPVSIQAKVPYGAPNDFGVIALARSKGSLEIASEPAGAEFILTGGDTADRTGKTPAKLDDLPTGTYGLKVRHQGSEQTAMLTVESRKMTPYVADFAYGSIDVGSLPVGATVILDDTESGQTPILLKGIKPGRHNIIVRYKDWDQVATLNVESKRNIKHVVEFGYGSLDINSAPQGATVFVEGKEKGKTPLHLDQVKPGSISVMVRHKDWDQTAGLRVESKQTTKHKFWMCFQNSLGMKFVPAGTPGVLFCVWETRVQDYEAFVKATGQVWKKPDFQQGPTHPAVNVSWEDAKAYCKWLSEVELKDGRLAAGQEYRLPLDKEWSLAVGLEREEGATPYEKSGRIEGFPWGKEWPPPKGAGNYASSLKVDDFDQTSPAGSFKANKFGLYDMGGNVWQWCEDLITPTTGDNRRVLRGGGWGNDYPRDLTSSFRDAVYPGYRISNYGFRCVVVVDSSASP